jgi:hypothetical protein
MQDYKTSFCCSNFPLAREIISPEAVDNFGTRFQEGSPALEAINYKRLFKQAASSSNRNLQCHYQALCT